MVTVLIFIATLQLGNNVMALFSDFGQIFSYVFIVWQVS